ncbi:DUF4260 family protein [Nocardia sp. NPDC058518]|uniref:DUF4260 family protein n=1 Tax=Nocardia sp. NPDC058518 TaxID=3346534 RepID=UPI0036689576
MPSTPRRRWIRRVAYAIAGIFSLTFAIFEMAKHGQPTLTVGIIALIAPDLTLFIGRTPPERGRLAPAAVPYYNLAHRTAGPWAVLLYFALVPDLFGDAISGPLEYLLPSTIPEAAAGFTVGLAWMAHICIDRALGFGLRAPDGRVRV